MFPTENSESAFTITHSKLFQQYMVYSWVKTEQNRLNYIRTHQTELRLDSLQGLMDYMVSDLL